MWRPLKGEPAGRRPQGSADIFIYDGGFLLYLYFCVVSRVFTGFGICVFMKPILVLFSI